LGSLGRPVDLAVAGHHVLGGPLQGFEAPGLIGYAAADLIQVARNIGKLHAE
jgi:hypothetical protein